MKKTLLTISIMAGLMMTACVKESANEQMGIPEGAMMLTTEGFQGHNTKTSVSGTSVQWVGDGTEKVYLNGNEYTVGIAGGNAFVNASSADKTGETYGYTGLEGTPTWTSGTKTLSVTVPAEYTSSYSGGRQVIALPMVAYKDATADKIEFKHVTAAVKVRIKNTVGEAVYLDKVVVKSAGKKLNGDVDVVLNDVDGMSTQTTSTASEKQVTVYFAFNTATINNYSTDADIVEVQVPILPLEASDLTVEVYTHKMVDHSSDNSGLLSVSYSYNFSATKNVAQDIDRNVMLTAGVNIQTHTVSPTTMNEVDHSLFTVASGKKVRFSKGNLQYQANSTNADAEPFTPVWRFAPNQYNAIGNAVGNTTAAANRISSTDWIDLFGWGAGDNPTNSSTNSGDYSSYNDWGTSASGSIGSDWRSLSSAYSGSEWAYLTTSRETTNTLSTNARYTLATIASSYKGMIVFPDNYLHPKDVVVGGEPVYDGRSDFVATISTLDDWAKMEASGAVFLPLTGQRYGVTVTNTTSGYYWGDGSSNYDFYFTSSTVSTGYCMKQYGCAVRLVKNAN